MPLRVMLRVRDLGGSEAAQAAAVLHDVLEDTATTREELAGMGFPAEVLDGVEAVTKRPEEQGAEAYMAFVRRAAGHPIGRLVKRADLEDNLNPRRLAVMTEKDRERYNRYLEAIRIVNGG